jgi:hypothetical protein
LRTRITFSKNLDVEALSFRFRINFLFGFRELLYLLFDVLSTLNDSAQLIPRNIDRSCLLLDNMTPQNPSFTSPHQDESANVVSNQLLPFAATSTPQRNVTPAQTAVSAVPGASGISCSTRGLSIG